MGLVVTLAVGAPDTDRARAVFDAVWPGEGSQVTPNLMRALLHAGGYCSIAIDEDTGEVVGAALGFPARNPGLPGGVYLHSHMAAAIEGRRDRGVGTLLKRHQREWALAQGIPVVSWTFDPLVRRNAYLNVIRLGVEVRDYHPDFYGEMPDAINAGDRTDRLVAWWEVGSRQAERAVRGEVVAPGDAELRGRYRDLISVADDGRPSVGAPPGPGETVLVSLPDDIVALRRADPDAGLAWRLAVREALTTAFARGLHVATVTTAGAYVLESREGSTA
ncbi:MAG: GNAT family N-acetyltransferase [bacterium]